jgi:2-polyprenyl-3-methyl-5-hydroxy-6-metoxy-1,4-benzoquinol methylase
MARNWKSAQKNEKTFWEGILFKKEDELYKPPSKKFIRDYALDYFNNFSLNLNSLDGKKIIDVGCGPFGIISGLYELTKNTMIFGVDPLMNDYVNFGYLPNDPERVTLLDAKGEDLLNLQDSFDFVFSRNVFDHVENPEKFAHSCSGLLNRNGKCYISYNIIYNYLNRLRFLMPYVDKNHPHHFTEAMSINILEKHFRKVEILQTKTIKEENPEFRFSKIFSSNKPIRAAKRWLSTKVLLTVYVECNN